MDILTRVLARQVYNLDMHDLPLDRLSEQKEKRRRGTKNPPTSPRARTFARGWSRTDGLSSPRIHLDPNKQAAAQSAMQAAQDAMTILEEKEGMGKVQGWLFINPCDAESNLVQSTISQKCFIIISTLSCWYLFESSHRTLSDEYPCSRVPVIFKHFSTNFILSKLATSSGKVKTSCWSYSSLTDLSG